MIEIEHLTRNYGGRPALAGISLAVKPGELVAVVGPNGSGKTTLFRLLLGLIGPTSGTIRIWGRSPHAQPGALMRRMGAVLDNHVPPPATRVRALLDLRAAAAPTFDRAWCGELLAELPGVTASRRFGELSKGQKQWVLSSLALAGRADLLVLDEPGDGLDTAARRRLFALLRTLVDERGTTVLVASHVLTDLERVADRLRVEGRHDPARRRARNTAQRSPRNRIRRRAPRFLLGRRSRGAFGQDDQRRNSGMDPAARMARPAVRLAGRTQPSRRRAGGSLSGAHERHRHFRG